MDKIINTPLWHHNSEVLKINVARDSGCFERILIGIYDQLTAMLELTSKVLVYRFEVFPNAKLRDSKLASNVAEEVNKFLVKQYDMKHKAYIWAKEQSKDKTTHYHFALILDGNKAQSATKTAEFLKSLNDKLAKKYGYDINIKPYKNPDKEFSLNEWKFQRGDEAIFQEVFYILSYLAKERSKPNTHGKARHFSCSRLKPRYKITAIKTKAA